ncbi:MAG: ankyrin repeat domain-containing protein [Bacteroidales bacterium]
MVRKLLIVTLLTLFVASISESLSGQAQQMVIDTSDYLPVPEGLDYNLAVAASKGYPYEIHRLIKLGANPDQPDFSGATPLIYAVANDMTEAVTALLSYDPDLDFLTGEGDSPLLIAAKYDFMDVGEALIRKGADINFRDRYGCTPLHYASIYGYSDFTDMLLYYEASVDHVTLDGTTPLISAVWAGDATVADMLLQSGADAGRADYQGFTPLHVAAQTGDTLIAALLLMNGADLNAVNKYGYNPLGGAIRSDQPGMTRYLINRMKKRGTGSSKAIDPSTIARSYSRKDILEILKDEGVATRPPLRFDMMTFSGYILFNLHDFYTGSTVSFTDPYHKLRINAGFDLKPAYTRVLVKVNDNLFYQYRDKRYLVHAGLSREFRLSENYLKETGLLATLNAGYLFREDYLGTNLQSGRELHPYALS